MKVAIISHDKSHLQETSKSLEAASHSVTLVEGGPGKLRSLVEQERPDLALLEGVIHGPDEFAQIEYVTTNYPQTAVILLSEMQSPAFLLDAMRAGVREVLVARPSAGALEAAVSRLALKLTGKHVATPGKILAFMSCKGGSGATFLATNLGYQLAEASSVLLIDLNLQFGDALSFVHDGKPASTLADVACDIRRLDASFLAASAVKVGHNYSILAAPEEPSQALEIKPEHIDAVLNVAVAQYDFVLLDIGRTIDPLSIKALDYAYRIFPVLQAELPYLRNAKKLLDVFRSLGYPVEKSEPIVNRFTKRGDIAMDDIQRLLGNLHLHTVPNSYKDVSASINQGHPLIKTARSNAVSRILAEFTQTLNPQQEEATGLFGRLFRRA